MTTSTHKAGEASGLLGWLPRITVRWARIWLLTCVVALILLVSQSRLGKYDYSRLANYNYRFSPQAIWEWERRHRNSDSSSTAGVSDSHAHAHTTATAPSHTFSNSRFDASKLGPLPRKIWQVWKNMDDETAHEIKNKWTVMNNGYAHTLLDDPSAIAYARKTAYGAPLAEFLGAVNNTGARSDLIRYLVLGEEGGVYSDSDTDPVKPIDEWVPAEYRERAKLVVGIEWDELGGDPDTREVNFLHTLQFCQWTIAASAGHVVFSDMLEWAMHKVDEYRIEQGKATVSQVEFKNVQVLNSTGPAAWTEVVFRYMRSVDPTVLSLKDFSGLKEPRLIGDVLLLPVDGFATNVPHSGAGKHPEQALIHHGFHGSWKHD
jgi:alpha 1,6-mannosyltransferase